MFRMILYFLFPPAAILFPPKRHRNKYVRTLNRGLRFAKAIDRMTKPKGRKRRKWQY